MAPSSKCNWSNSRYVYRMFPQLCLTPATTQDTYIQSRSTAIESIETTIAELGQIFTQLATMVAEQRETVQRIDADTLDIAANVGGAQRELLKYYASISSNRMLMLKVVGVLIVFVGQCSRIVGPRTEPFLVPGIYPSLWMRMPGRHWISITKHLLLLRRLCMQRHNSWDILSLSLPNWYRIDASSPLFASSATDLDMLLPSSVCLVILFVPDRPRPPFRLHLLQSRGGRKPLRPVGYRRQGWVIL